MSKSNGSGRVVLGQWATGELHRSNVCIVNDILFQQNQSNVVGILQWLVDDDGPLWFLLKRRDEILVHDEPLNTQFRPLQVPPANCADVHEHFRW